jgi:hypothetical protein
MVNTGKEKKTKKLVIIIAAAVIIFALFGTMLIDALLVKLEISPVFSKIVSDSYNDGEYINGFGILYSTIETRVDLMGGHIAGYRFFFGHRKWNNDESFNLTLKYHADDGTVTEIMAERQEIIPLSSFVFEEELDEELYILNIDAVRQLADGYVTPFEFMERFPCNVSDVSDVSDVSEANGGENPVSRYHVALPNDYALQIEYSGEEIIYIYFFDLQHGKYIDLISQQIDIFLLERD